jgi:hypothetical protein
MMKKNEIPPWLPAARDAWKCHGERRLMQQLIRLANNKLLD